MIKVIEAINEEKVKNFSIFLAGGITNCPPWQTKIIEKLKKEDTGKSEIVLFNPRRKNFPIHDPNASKKQITWEYNKLKESDMIIYWFSKGSLNPIVLYELGMWGNSRETPIIIGIDKGYERQQDVEIQTELAKPDALIVYSIDDMVTAISETLKYVK